MIFADSRANDLLFVATSHPDEEVRTRIGLELVALFSTEITHYRFLRELLNENLTEEAKRATASAIETLLHVYVNSELATLQELLSIAKDSRLSGGVREAAGKNYVDKCLAYDVDAVSIFSEAVPGTVMAYATEKIISHYVALGRYETLTEYSKSPNLPNYFREMASAGIASAAFVCITKSKELGVYDTIISFITGDFPVEVKVAAKKALPVVCNSFIQDHNSPNNIRFLLLLLRDQDVPLEQRIAAGMAAVRHTEVCGDIMKDEGCPLEVRVEAGKEHIKYLVRNRHADGLKALRKDKKVPDVVKKLATEMIEEAYRNKISTFIGWGDFIALWKMAWFDLRLSPELRKAAKEGISPAADKLIKGFVESGDYARLELWASFLLVRVVPSLREIRKRLLAHVESAELIHVERLFEKAKEEGNLLKLVACFNGSEKEYQLGKNAQELARARAQEAAKIIIKNKPVKHSLLRHDPIYFIAKSHFFTNEIRHAAAMEIIKKASRSELLGMSDSKDYVYSARLAAGLRLVQLEVEDDRWPRIVSQIYLERISDIDSLPEEVRKTAKDGIERYVSKIIARLEREGNINGLIGVKNTFRDYGFAPLADAALGRIAVAIAEKIDPEGKGMVLGKTKGRASPAAAPKAVQMRFK